MYITWSCPVDNNQIMGCCTSLPQVNAVTGTLFTSHVMKQATNQEPEQEDESKENNNNGEQVSTLEVNAKVLRRHSFTSLDNLAIFVI